MPFETILCLVLSRCFYYFILKYLFPRSLEHKIFCCVCTVKTRLLNFLQIYIILTMQLMNIP